MPDGGDLPPASAPPVANGDASSDLLALPEGTKVRACSRPRCWTSCIQSVVCEGGAARVSSPALVKHGQYPLILPRTSRAQLESPGVTSHGSLHALASTQSATSHPHVLRPAHAERSNTSRPQLPRRRGSCSTATGRCWTR